MKECGDGHLAIGQVGGDELGRKKARKLDLGRTSTSFSFESPTTCIAIAERVLRAFCVANKAAQTGPVSEHSESSTHLLDRLFQVRHLRLL